MSTAETKTASAAVTAKTYQILESRVADLVDTIEKLARRAKRLKLPEIVITRGATHAVAYVKSGTSLRRYTADMGDIIALERQDAVRYRHFVDVTVSGTTPQLAGWTFAATLQHLVGEGGEALTLLRTVPGLDADMPERFRTASPEQCDHCQRKIRTRKETFVVRHDDGRWAQVGRNCTQDFLGNLDPHAVAAALDMLLEAFGAAEGLCGDGEDGGGGRIVDRWSIRSFLGVVAMLVRAEGWTSRGKARDSDVTATADSTVAYLSPPKEGSLAYDRWLKWTRANPVTDADAAIADKALDFARTEFADRDDLSDYEHNLRVAVKLPSVDGKLAGIVASLVPFYLRSVEAVVLKAAEQKTSRYLGVVGERLSLTVRLAKVIVVGEMSQWGASYLHKFVTTDGCALVWFASSKGMLVEGGEYTIKATVKKHDTRDGVAQTVVTRVKAA